MPTNRYDYDGMVRWILAFKRDAGIPPDVIRDNLPRLKARFLHLAKNEVIERQGARASVLGLVIRGQLQLKILTPDGESVLMRAVRPGEYVGHSMIFQREDIVPCEVCAYPECDVIAFDIAAIRAWCKEPDAAPFVQMISDQLCRSLRVAWQRGVIVSHRSLEERVMAYLKIRAAEDQTREIVMPGTIDDFAEFLACERTALSRAISALCSSGKIRRDGRSRLVLLTPSLKESRA